MRHGLTETIFRTVLCLTAVGLGAGSEVGPAYGGDGESKRAAEPWSIHQADTMEKVFRDRRFDRPRADKLVIEAAGNEVEGVQLVLAAQEELRGVTLDVTGLRGESGSTIPASEVSWHVVGYVEIAEKPPYPVPQLGWWPDPLLPGAAFNVAAGRVQPIWISVRVPAAAAAGLYRGTVTVRTSSRTQSVPLEVHVWDFAVPRQQHLETCFLLRPDNLRRFYKLSEVPIETYERWIDFCVDHRLSLTLNDWPRYDKDMERLVSRQLDRGGSAFCLACSWFSKDESAEARRKHNAEQVARIMPLYDRAKSRGWIDRAYIYCSDEVAKEHYLPARELYAELKRTMPDVRLMQTFYKDDPIPALGPMIDVWAPNIARYREAEFRARQAQSDAVWWYVCCGPGKPFANLMIEWPSVDHRILLWQNWKYGVTGFLYWGTTMFRDNCQGEARWPDVPWKPATWRNSTGQPHHGDGQLIYPGRNGTPLSSIRLENFRDGIEDYEYFWLLREAVTELERSDVTGHEKLMAEARRALAVDESVVRDLEHFTDDPLVVRRARAQIARLIERLQAAVHASGSDP